MQRNYLTYFLPFELSCSKVFKLSVNYEFINCSMKKDLLLGKQYLVSNYRF